MFWTYRIELSLKRSDHCSPGGMFTYLFRIAAVDDYVFLLDWENGLRVVDISDYTHPSQAAEYPLPGGFIPELHGFELQDDRIYYVHCEGLPTVTSNIYMVDISTPTAPAELDIHTLSDSLSVEGFGIESGVACCWVGNYGDVERLYFLNLLETYEYSQPGIPRSITNYGEYLYVPLERGDLRCL